MGCCQPTSFIEPDLMLLKDHKPGKNATFSFNDELDQNMEEVVVNESDLFNDDKNKVHTFRTKRNDIEPFNREELLEVAMSISNHAIYKLMKRKKKELKETKSHTIDIDTTAILKNAFGMRLS